MDLAELQKQAAKGSSQAETILGSCYLEGIEVQQDYAAALHWLNQAAGQGVWRAVFHLARMNEEGLGVPVNYERAFHLYCQAAEHQEYLAYPRLAAMCREGRGTQVDEQAAIRWEGSATALTKRLQRIKLRRRSALIVAGLCLFAFGILVVIWVLGRIGFSATWDFLLASQRYGELDSYGGRLELTISRYANEPIMLARVPWRMRDQSWVVNHSPRSSFLWTCNDPNDAKDKGHLFEWFHYESEEDINGEGLSAIIMRIPYWFIALLLLGFPALYLVVRSRRRPEEGTEHQHLPSGSPLYAATDAKSKA